MPIQDDSREKQMIDRFNLEVPENRRRADIDAYLQLGDLSVPFELKSTTNGSIATARDFGMGHIEKWRSQQIHWLFGFYLSREDKADYFIYCSPAKMEEWYANMESYIKPDLILGSALPENVNSDMVVTILGEKDIYTHEEARSIMKNQYARAEYFELMDKKAGYSLERMTEILKARASYVFARGATLNNPHIRAAFFDGLPHIVNEPAIRLRELVRDYLENKSATDEAAR